MSIPSGIDGLAAAAAAQGIPFLQEMVVLFSVSAALAYVCYRLHLVPIVGFLVAGVLIGPYALGLVRDAELIASTAEIGIVLLLFTLGVEFSLEKLARIKRFIVLGGSVQVGLTIALAAAVLLILGVHWRSAVYTGCLVALSSTAVVVNLLSDRGVTDTPAGQITLGILIFQDLFIIPLVLLVPVLAVGEGSTLQVGLAILESTAIIVLVLFAAWRVVPWVLDRVAHVRRPELFLLTVVVICFGIAWLANLGGVSLALGAFLAGLAVSRSRFREHAVGEIIPLRTIFNAVFFVSIGMLLDLRFVVANALVIVTAVGAVLVLKTMVAGAGVLLLRYPATIALGVGSTLAQVGEFSLVLHQVGRESGLTPAGLGATGEQAFLGVAVLLMALTPILSHLEPRRVPLVSGWRLGPKHRTIDEGVAGAVEGPSNHVVIGGFGLAGQSLKSALEAHRIPYIVVDLNPVSSAAAEASGTPVIWGDLGHLHVLHSAGVERAKLVVIAINDPEAVGRIVQRLKMTSPTVPVIVRVPYITDLESLQALGADTVVTEELEAAARLVELTLRTCGVPPEEADNQVECLRAEAERS